MIGEIVTLVAGAAVMAAGLYAIYKSGYASANAKRSAAWVEALGRLDKLAEEKRKAAECAEDFGELVIFMSGAEFFIETLSECEEEHHV